MRKDFALLSLLLFIFSCKGLRDSVGSNNKYRIKTPEDLFEAYQNVNMPDFENMVIKATATYEDQNRRQSLSLDIRILKNQKVWISGKMLSIPLAKLYVKNQEVSFYEKINQRYFEGGFNLIEDWLGYPVDYQMFENVFLGQMIPQKQGNYYLYKKDNKIQLENKSNINALYEFDRSNLNLESQLFENDRTDQTLLITFMKS